jgi:hypothetical protein
MHNKTLIRQKNSWFLFIVSKFIKLSIFSFFMLSAFLTCDDFSIYNLGGNNTENPEISPKSINIAQNSTCTFQGKDGDPPYVFSIQSGAGIIDSSTGIYTSPGFTTDDVILLTDSNGNTDTASVTVNTPLSISPETVYMEVGTTQLFTGNGGELPYTYTVLSGGGSFSSNIYTAPMSPGTAMIRLTDNNSSTKNATVNIVAANMPIIAPAVITLTVGDTQTFTATNGTGPYTYSILAGGVGSINSGTGVYNATTVGIAVVRVTDSYSNTCDATVTVNTAGSDPLRIIPDDKIEINRYDDYTFSAEGGTPPYTFSLDNPGKGTINSSTGYYVADGTPGEVNVIVTDKNSTQDSVTVKILN